MTSPTRRSTRGLGVRWERDQPRPHETPLHPMPWRAHRSSLALAKPLSAPPVPDNRMGSLQDCRSPTRMRNVDLSGLVGVVLGAALALAGGVFTEQWKQRREHRAAARLIWLELVRNWAIMFGAAWSGEWKAEVA